MSDVNFTQPNPHGTGRNIAPLLIAYLRDPQLTALRPKTWEDCRDMLTQCAIFIVRERADRAMSLDEVLNELCEMVWDRNALGEKKYGEGLRAHNGRDCTLDALQEVLDGQMYTTQKIEES